MEGNNEGKRWEGNGKGGEGRFLYSSLSPSLPPLSSLLFSISFTVE